MAPFMGLKENYVKIWPSSLVRVNVGARRGNGSIAKTPVPAKPLHSILIANRGEIALLVDLTQAFQNFTHCDQARRKNSFAIWN